MEIRVRRVAGLATLAAVGVLALLLVPPGAEAAQKKCFGKKPTIKSNATTINGTNGNDVIIAGNGDNQINARKGFDLICAGGGNDNRRRPGPDQGEGPGRQGQLRGRQPGRHLLRRRRGRHRGPGRGRDEIHGGPGNDGSNNDLGGDAGNDRIFGDGGNDNIDGGDGDDNASDCETEVSIP